MLKYDASNKARVVNALRNNLPPEVRRLKHFVIFKFGVPAKKDAKPLKIPYYADGGIRKEDHGSGADRDRLVGFANALRAFQNVPSAAGIGLATLKDNGITLVDLDNCVNEFGMLSDLAKEIVSWGSYTEFSPSGAGLRVVFIGNMGTNGKNNDLGIELFCTKGFATLTGNSYHRKPRSCVKLSEDQIQVLRDRVGFREPSSPDEPGGSIPSSLNDTRLRDVKRALSHVHPDCTYDDWLMVGQALHSGNPGEDGAGFRLWLRWSKSKNSEKFSRTSEEEMLAKWRGFQRGRGVTLSSIFHLAKQHGYKPGREAKRAMKEDPVKASEDDIARRLAAITDSEKVGELKLDPIADGLMDHVGCYLFIGRAKIGKSRILGLFTAAALSGGKAFGHQFTARCKTLCVTTEESAHSIYERLKLYNVDPADYTGQLVIVDRKLLLRHAQDMAEDMTHVEWLAALLRKYRPRFCYIDTLVGLRMVWRNEPEGRAYAATERDYQIVQEIEELGEQYGCAIVCSVHGSKRKGINAAVGFDPFEQIGTTSWSVAAAAGAFVIMDKLGHNPVGENAQEDDGQRIFSVRGRYRVRGDEHLLIQTDDHGSLRSLGAYASVRRTMREAELVEAMQELTEGDAEAVISASVLAAHMAVTRQTVSNIVAGLVGQTLADGSRIVALHGRSGGYKLVDQKGAKKPPYEWE